MHPTLIPAYGRDYKSKAAVEADWQAGEDFKMAGLCPGYVNIADARAQGWRGVNIRYGQLRKVCVVEVK